MDIIQLILVIVVFAVVVWGLGYLCDRFNLPVPVRWLVGALLIVILLLFMLRVTGVYPIDISKPVVR